METNCSLYIAKCKYILDQTQGGGNASVNPVNYPTQTVPLA